MDVVGINKEFFFFKNKNKENCHDDVIYNNPGTYHIRNFIDQTVPCCQNYIYT